METLPSPGTIQLNSPLNYNFAMELIFKSNKNVFQHLTWGKINCNSKNIPSQIYKHILMRNLHPLFCLLHILNYTVDSYLQQESFNCGVLCHTFLRQFLCSYNTLLFCGCGRNCDIWSIQVLHLCFCSSVSYLFVIKMKFRNILSFTNSRTWYNCVKAVN